MDKISPERRSWTMSQVRSSDTKPERLVRSYIHRHGFRFTLRNRGLPGKPDIVLFKYRVAIFVHGCFWHRQLRPVLDTVTSHGVLDGCQCWIVGNLAYVRFRFTTGDAMGMNIATLATDALCSVIQEKTEAQLVALSSNMCSDKKPATINALCGRGHFAAAESRITWPVLSKTLKTDADSLLRIVTVKNHVGSAMAGAPNHLNAHFANVLAGIYAATGQDLAQIVESSMGTVLGKVTKTGDLNLNVTLPCIEVGTVGGGTDLPYAVRNLEIADCAGGGTPPGTNATRLAALIAATCLAGELSLLSSLAEGTLARAHRKHRKSSKK